MNPRTVLGAITLTAMPLLLATPAQATAPETSLSPKSLNGAPAAPAQAADGPLGPGLSELVALAEGILRKYGIV